MGELSAINGVMGSKAHRLPVFHLVGMPSERIQHQGLITHHNLGDTVYDRFQSLSAAACCVSAVLTPDNCIDELERVIREALRLSMPAYIVISEVHGIMPVIGTPVTGKPLASIKRQQSNRKELDAAVATILNRLSDASNPVAIVTALPSRYGVADRATEFIKKASIPVAVMPNDKGTVAELDAALERIASEDSAAYIEVMIPNEESQPLPASIIEGGYKLETPPIG